MANDYYKTLGVQKKATQEEIQKAYRTLAKKFHPDHNPDDKTAKKKFQEVQQAYDVLGDAKKRGQYDQYGPGFEQINQGQPPPGYEQFFGGAEGGQTGFDLDDLLRQFTGGGGGGFGFNPQATGRRRGKKGAAAPGADLTHELTIPFRAAVVGDEVHLNVQRPGGDEETLAVKIPAGIESGQTIRLRGQGNPSPSGGLAGDLLITMRVAPHPSYTRDGLNLTVKVPVTLAEAALGAKVDVPSPHGVITMKIPAGTSSGKKIRVKGYGVRKKDAEKGDLYAEILIVIPESLDEASAELVRKLDARLKQTPREGLAW